MADERAATRALVEVAHGIVARELSHHGLTSGAGGPGG